MKNYLFLFLIISTVLWAGQDEENKVLDIDGEQAIQYIIKYCKGMKYHSVADMCKHLSETTLIKKEDKWSVAKKSSNIFLYLKEIAQESPPAGTIIVREDQDKGIIFLHGSDLDKLVFLEIAGILFGFFDEKHDMDDRVFHCADGSHIVSYKCKQSN